MTTKQTLERARDLLARSGGWSKGALQRPDDSNCAIGAINRALGLPQNEEADYVRVENKAAIDAVGAILPGSEEAWVRVVSYNDSASTDHACILAAFDAAIEKADAT